MIKKRFKKGLSLFMVLTACLFITPVTASAEGIGVVGNNNASVREIPYKPTVKSPKNVYHASFSQNAAKSYSYYYFDSYNNSIILLSVYSFSGSLNAQILDYYTDEVLYSKTFYEGESSSLWGPISNRTVYIKFTGSSPIGAEYILELTN